MYINMASSKVINNIDIVTLHSLNCKVCCLKDLNVGGTSIIVNLS